MRQARSSVSTKNSAPVEGFAFELLKTPAVSSGLHKPAGGSNVKLQ